MNQQPFKAMAILKEDIAPIGNWGSSKLVISNNRV